MATNKGHSFEVSGNSIKLFGLPGVRMGSGDWAVGILFGDTENDYVAVQVSPAPVLSSIEAVIADDVAAGREELIDHVLVTSRIAVCLFLEGVLTPSHFIGCKEEDGSVIIDKVRLGGKERKLVIRSEITGGLEYKISTRDKDGNLV